MDGLKCNRCGAVRETSDNFCRRCGHQLTVNLPAVSESKLPAIRRTLPPSLVGSMTLLAVGTGLEWLARRMAGTAAKAAGRALIGAGHHPQPPARSASSDTVTVDEVLYVRKVQLRR